MTLAIYRAANPTFVASSDVLVGQTTLNGAELDVGTHQVAVTLSQTLDIDPAMKAPTPKTGDSSVIPPPANGQAK